MKQGKGNRVLYRERTVHSKHPLPQHKRRLYMWTSPDDQYKNQIYYILCNQDGEALYSQQKTRPRADCGSDHEFLIAKFRLKMKKVGKTTIPLRSVQFSHSVVFLLSETPWTAACQASLSITNSQSLLKFMSIESVMLSNHLILCRPLLHLSSIFPSIRSFQISQFFTSGGQSIGGSASASVLSMNIQD